MTGFAICIMTRPTIFILNRVNKSCFHHSLPERPRMVPCVHPYVVMRKGLPNVSNNFSSYSLPPHLGIYHANIVDLDVVSVGYHSANSVRKELREVEPAWFGANWGEPLSVCHCRWLTLVYLLSLMCLFLHFISPFVLYKWWSYPDLNRNLKLRRQLCYPYYTIRPMYLGRMIQSKQSQIPKQREYLLGRNRSLLVILCLIIFSLSVFC